MANKRSISRLLSLMLRHRPDEFGLNIDEYGYVPLDQVVQAVQERHEEVTEEDIVALANEPDQHRFELTERGIRALYGHSFFVEMDGEPMEPPDVLYMGSTAAAARRMKSQGILPGDRFYVHLSLSREAASERSREDGRPVVVEVLAREAGAAGVAFYARGAVVLTREVPPEFVGTIHGLEAPAEQPTTGGLQVPRSQVKYGRKPRKDRRR